MTLPEDARSVLNYVDWTLGQLCLIVGDLCREAHMSDEDIKDILSQGNSDHLEIISDEADSALLRIEQIVTEARLSIQTLVATYRAEADRG
ncbi:MAG: hypothetical protein MUE52_04245 [Tabrizicola sp.]|jgi:hypothetical protein|nr:hypothetical protein [Tabrizicola sp.]